MVGGQAAGVSLASMASPAVEAGGWSLQGVGVCVGRPGQRGAVQGWEVCLENVVGVTVGPEAHSSC